MSSAALHAEASEARASGSSFYTAMRLMSPMQRRGMFAIYSFCRIVDDIADGPESPEVQRTQLNRWRHEIDAIYIGTPLQFQHDLAWAVEQYGLHDMDFHAIIDGMEMDVNNLVHAPHWPELDLYCDRVASAVGRLSVRVFGMDEGPGHKLAHHLGRALQLTNILRDLDEDADVGRLYLPRECIEEAGIASVLPRDVLSHGNIGRVCTAVADRAESHFSEAEKTIARQPRAIARTPRLMSDVYRLMLRRMVKRGWSAPRQPVKLSRFRIAQMLLWNIIA